MKKLIKNVKVFDGKHGELSSVQSIVIEENLVKELIKGVVSEENFDVVIDGKGMTAMPGMTDAHVHLGVQFQNEENIDYGVAISTAVAKKMLYKGFTTVRDAGGIVQGMKKAFDLGALEGPRILPSNSCISQTCGHGDFYDHSMKEIQYKIPTFSVLADGVSEVIHAVREQFYKGASQIKIMAGGGCSSVHDPLQTVQFSYEEIKAAVDTAKDYGTYVMAHLYTPECIQRALRAGVKSLEHAHLMDEESAKMIQDYGAFVAPMPQFGKPSFPHSPKGMLVLNGESNATELTNKYDLKILFGTDCMINNALYEPKENEDLLYYKKRFGSFKGLVSATGNIYELLKLSTYQNPYPEGKIGVLEEGAFADILLVDGNPIEDLAVLSDSDNLRLIMKNAVIYKNTL